jgi:hypothetical protein
MEADGQIPVSLVPIFDGKPLQKCRFYKQPNHL